MMMAFKVKYKIVYGYNHWLMRMTSFEQEKKLQDWSSFAAIEQQRDV
jgi:hypothetical protein